MIDNLAYFICATPHVCAIAFCWPVLPTGIYIYQIGKVWYIFKLLGI